MTFIIYSRIILCAVGMYFIHWQFIYVAIAFQLLMLPSDIAYARALRKPKYCKCGRLIKHDK